MPPFYTLLPHSLQTNKEEHAVSGGKSSFLVHCVNLINCPQEGQTDDRSRDVLLEKHRAVREGLLFSMLQSGSFHNL